MCLDRYLFNRLMAGLCLETSFSFANVLKLLSFSRLESRREADLLEKDSLSLVCVEVEKFVKHLTELQFSYDSLCRKAPAAGDVNNCGIVSGLQRRFLVSRIGFIFAHVSFVIWFTVDCHLVIFVLFFVTESLTVFLHFFSHMLVFIYVYLCMYIYIHVIYVLVFTQQSVYYFSILLVFVMMASDHYII